MLLDRLIEAEEAPAVRTRHLSWFQQAYATPPDWAAPVAPDLENLRAARAWAHETGDGEGVARLTVTLYWQGHAYDGAVLEEREWGHLVLASAHLEPALRAQVLTVTSFRDIGAGDWAAGIAHARDALALAPDPGEGVLAGAAIPLAIALMVTDPDAAERAIDEGIERIRRARAPAFSEALLASFKVGTALMRGDPTAAVERGHGLEAAAGVMQSSLGVAFALHLLGDHDGAEADMNLRRSNVRESGIGMHSRHLLRALAAGARRRWGDAARELAAAASLVRRYRYPLTLNDCVVVCGALAALEGRLERACVLLAAVADRSFVRTPEMWAVYRHYRDVVRAGLDAATIRRCRDEARTTDLDRALTEELARRPTPT